MTTTDAPRSSAPPARPPRTSAGGSLRRRGHPLADPAAQRRVLDAVPLPRPFADAVAGAALPPLRALGIDVMQINVGKFCNQTCRHCHVDAGPDRTEIMSGDVVDACLNVLRDTAIPTVDLTGGAPELHDRFRDIVETATRLGRRVINRANLTALLMPAQADLVDFLARQRVEIVASLPYFQARQTDAQRGAGVFDRSIEALQRLNAAGYGVEGSGLQLNLIVNPVGTFLPGSQASLQRDYQRELDRRHGVRFNKLYTMTNLPIGRFLEFLHDGGKLDDYVHMLARSFNPATLPAVMCRTMLSVAWDGRLHDCDFNQMLELALDDAAPQTIFDFDADRLATRAIVVGPHCYGCTAGAGASCGGSLA